MKVSGEVVKPLEGVRHRTKVDDACSESGINGMSPIGKAAWARYHMDLFGKMTAITGGLRGGRPRYTGFTPCYVVTAGVAALTESLALEVARDNILETPSPLVPLCRLQT